MVKLVSRNTYVRKAFCFCTQCYVLYCQSSDRLFIAANAVVHLLNACLLLVSTNQQHLLDNMEVWLWVGEMGVAS